MNYFHNLVSATKWFRNIIKDKGLQFILFPHWKGSRNMIRFKRQANNEKGLISRFYVASKVLTDID